MYMSNVTFTFESKINGSRSIIDHFIISESLINSVEKYYDKHDIDNLSDHYPICMSLNVQIERSPSESYVSNNSKLLWEKATELQIVNYKNMLDLKLSEIQIPMEAIQCKNVFCEKHCNDIVSFHDDIINAYIMSSFCNIPVSSKNGCKIIPGWNEHVKEKREKCLFWHELWKENGCPHNGHIANIRRQSRAQYHHAIKYVKKNKESIKAENMANNLLQNKSCDFWREVKKVKSSKGNKVASSIDGQSSGQNICDVFLNKYECLYNSVSYDKAEMNSVKTEINKLIENKCICDNCYNNHTINTNDVCKAISNLKTKKSDGMTDQMSDHFINGTCRSHIYLSLLFQGMLMHAVVPQSMLLGTIIPIPKNKRKSLNESSNYRGITLSSIMGKILDNIILNTNTCILKSSDLQFGFKAKHSTTHCTFVAQEVINYYISRDSIVYCVLLDASQAFDRVHYVKLFKLLLKKGLCPITARLLAYMYTKQQLRVKYGNNVSNNFNVTNGVKQGGVLSPILFVLYMDELFLKLKNAQLGCYIGTLFVGAIGYADDATIMAPTLTSINSMLSIVTKYGKEFCVKFNAMKTKLVVYGSNTNEHQVTFDGVSITNTRQASHLGNVLGENVNAICIDQCISSFMTSFNYIFATFKFCTDDVKYKLFKSYCMSLYGCTLLDLSGKYIEKFYVTW